MKLPNGTVIKGVSLTVLAIISAVFALEQGSVNNPDDPGGATNHGITQAVAVKHGCTHCGRDRYTGLVLLARRKFKYSPECLWRADNS